MNKRKLRRLLESARCEESPAPPDDFVLQVTQTIHREPKRGPRSIFDELALLFPRLALAAFAVISICIGGNVLLTSLGGPGLADGVAQISGQWLLAGTGI